MSKRHGLAVFAIFISIWIFIFIAFRGCAVAHAAPIPTLAVVAITPIPEPSTYAIGSAVVLSILIWRRHKKR